MIESRLLDSEPSIELDMNVSQTGTVYFGRSQMPFRQIGGIVAVQVVAVHVAARIGARRIRTAILALPGISGLALDITTKPPGTIEWE